LQTLPEPAPVVNPVLKKFKLALFASKTAADTLFLPYDAQHNGFVPVVRIRPILEDFGFAAAPADVESLITAFQDPRLPERFNYRKLIQAMNEIQLTQSDLATSHIEVAARATSPQALRFATEFREKILARHKAIRTPFAGMTARGLPPRDFRRCVESFGLVIKESDMQMLLREYRLNMQGDIDWQRFCTDVEANRTV
jgi:Ca2+-binding EF-hand superfamily protein